MSKKINNKNIVGVSFIFLALVKPNLPKESNRPVVEYSPKIPVANRVKGHSNKLKTVQLIKPFVLPSELHLF